MPNTALLRKSLKALDAARPAYVKAHKFYEGTFAEPFASLLMQRVLVASQPDYKMVLSAVPVDAVVEKLEIVDVRTSDPDATAFLQDNVWAANNMELEHLVAILAAEKFGDAYLFMWPETAQVVGYDQATGSEAENIDEELDEEEDELEDGEEVMTMTYQSPLKVRVFYDESNPRLMTHAVKRLKTGRGVQECAWLYYADGRIEKYETPEDKCGLESFKYVEDIPNPLEEIPFIHLRNGFPYGTPLHRKAYGPQNALTKLVVNQLSGSDFDAFPQRWALAKTRGTSGGDDIEWSGDDGTVPDSDEGSVSTLTSGPGRIWDLTGFDSVGQFSTGDVGQFLQPIEKYTEMMAVATGTPAYYFSADSVGGGTPSGEAVRQRDARLNTKTERHQKILNNGFERALQMALDYFGFDDVSVSIKWKPIEYITEEERLALVKQKTDLGIPLAVALAEAGYDEDTVRLWTTGQPTETELDRRVDMLVKLADGLQKLGTAATLGIDMTDINEIVKQLTSGIQGLNEDDEEEVA